MYEGSNCYRCGQGLTSTDVDGLCSKCQQEKLENEQSAMFAGWRCKSCNALWSIFVSYCPKCAIQVK